MLCKSKRLMEFTCIKTRLEKKTVRRMKVFATLRVLGTVLKEITREMAPHDGENLISEEVFFFL